MYRWFHACYDVDACSVLWNQRGDEWSRGSVTRKQWKSCTGIKFSIRHMCNLVSCTYISDSLKCRNLHNISQNPLWLTYFHSRLVNESIHSFKNTFFLLQIKPSLISNYDTPLYEPSYMLHVFVVCMYELYIWYNDTLCIWTSILDIIYRYGKQISNCHLI